MEPLFSFLRRHAGLTEGELADLTNGKPLIRVIPETDKHASSVIGIIQVAPRTGIDLTAFRESIGQRANPSRSGGGPISIPPKISDLDGFRPEARDIDDLRNCRPGKCGVKLSPQMIRSLSELPEAASASSNEIARVYKQMLIDYVAEYIEGGDKALIDYDAPRKPVRLVEEYAAIYSKPNLADLLAPEFGRYLRTFPTKPAGVEDRFDWAIVETGLRPIFSITHSSAYSKRTDGTDVFILAAKQIYASHYIDATLAVFVLVISNSSESPKGFLVFSNTSRSAALAGVFGGIVHSVAEGQAEERVGELLIRAKSRLEAAAPHSESEISETEPLAYTSFLERLAENWSAMAVAAAFTALAVYLLLLRRRR